MPKFFIDRPIFAWVLSLLIMMAGILAITHLPVAQYPSVAPPSIAITANYAGASAETVQDTVTSVIEQQMNGIDHLLYMSSSSSASGQSTVTLYFDVRHRPGHRAGAGAEQIATGRAQPAARRSSNRASPSSNPRATS